MFFCLSCGNALEFEVSVWTPVTVDSMTGPIHVSMELDPSRYDFAVRCYKCARSDVRNLRLVTPRNLVNEIARTRYRDILCPVSAIHLAREWFLTTVPHLSSWMEDESVGGVLIGAETFRRIPAVEDPAEEEADDSLLTPSQ